MGERLKLVAGARWQKVETRAAGDTGLGHLGPRFLRRQPRRRDQLPLPGDRLAQPDRLVRHRLPGAEHHRAAVQRRHARGLGLPDPQPRPAPPRPARTSTSASSTAARDALMELVAFRTDLEDGIIQDFLSGGDRRAAARRPGRHRRRAAPSSSCSSATSISCATKAIEFAAGYRTATTSTVGGNYTHLDAERRLDRPPCRSDDRTTTRSSPTCAGSRGAEAVVGGVHGSATTARRRHQPRPGEPAPAVGDELPSFTVHTTRRAACVLFERGRSSTTPDASRSRT